jgi:hypothetical protein
MPRGGKREGAGRKPSPAGSIKKQYCNRFNVEILEYFRQLENAAETIEKLVASSRGFKNWKKNKDPDQRCQYEQST